jgi:hypothetical protein
MSDDLSLGKVQFTDVFKRQVRDLAKRYRKIGNLSNALLLTKPSLETSDR